jgi:peptidoglycan/LPS O-acetylase OafA/YrhL
VKEQSTFVAPEKLICPVMPELDSLRGLAILGVLFLHGFIWQYSGFHFTAGHENFF